MPQLKLAVPPLDRSSAKLIIYAYVGFVLITLCSVWSNDVYAEENAQPPQIRSVFSSGVAQSRNLLGQTAASIGIGLDSLFGSPDRSQQNESTLILQSGFFFDDVEAFSLFNRFSFRADLPSTTEKLQLFVRGQQEESVSEVQTVSSNSLNGATAIDRSIKASNAGIFIRYIYKPEDHMWQTTLDTGFAFSNFAVEPVSYLRAGRNYQMNEWTLRPVPNLSWSESVGVSYGLALHAYRELDRITSLQNSNTFSHVISSDTNYYSHGWQLNKTFSSNLRVVYNLTLTSADDTAHFIDTFELSATLRRRVQGEWLFFSVTPADRRKAEDQFTRDLSLTLQFDAKFGTQY
ncbi:hypothetical protein SAMN02745127_01867 [Oceanospirillum multiglobuliferum]|uniref:DUF481 domain-containing protein n=1 Tax=Oceanospirillum multiglobuliferum TaxID=64969 RepID=A0A1T4QDV8_9GAMM|nr:hypothetical protein [Oceanospirillum multiglobuliferum]OPX56498.1 hypothetical protein BTE48_03470 [Oceanospirillum multiglobuliferum]SKA01874.1 hypothetical protein SAMN02745127_01867 [Oceanospirillum multiglobuliferum]